MVYYVVFLILGEMRHEQVILGSEWFDIPDTEGRYQINRDGDVRAFYKYEGHRYKPHYKVLKGDNDSYVLVMRGKRTKVCSDYLYELCFGIQHVESLDGEIWVSIRGYEGYYKISNMGRVFAERRFLIRKNGVVQFCKEQIVQAKSVINSGYYAVNLLKDKKLKHFLIHRLVAEHFIDNPHGYGQVNHKDENKKNNVASNLEWCDRSYNQTYGTCQERRIATRLMNNNGNYGYKRIANR